MKRRDFLRLSISAAIAGMSSGFVGGLMVPTARAVPLRGFLADPAIQPLFTELAPNALDPGFIFGNNGKKKKKKKKTEFEISVTQTKHKTGLVNKKGKKLKTTIWGYGDEKNGPTWPGRTFEVDSGKRVKVKWLNGLKKRNKKPLPHLLPVDESMHWCYSLHGYKKLSIKKDGVPLVPHLHGGHSDSDFDGNPEYFFGITKRSRGPRYVTDEYKYDNSQPAGTLWYHDHALGITRLNVYAGLAGFYIIRDKKDTGRHNNPLSLPAEQYELAYAVQDRMFRKNGELFYPAFEGDPAWDDFITGEGAHPPIPGGPSALAEFFGDHIVVNGKIWPKANVEPRNYRIRFLNGCDSRFMRLRFRMVNLGETELDTASAPLPFYLVGSDQGLLRSPALVSEVDFMPGERQDLVFDFSSVPFGTRIIVDNVLGDAPFGGHLPDTDDLFPDRRTDRVMAFDIIEPLSNVPDNFNAAAISAAYSGNNNGVDKTRRLALYEGKDEYERLQPLLGTAEPVTAVDGSTLNGSIAWHQPITENPDLGATEIWEIFNATEDAHPVHVHLVNFQILDRAPFMADVVQQDVLQHNGAIGTGFRLENISTGGRTSASPSEDGPKDMVIALPGEVTRIKMTFDKPGRYVWHCHILSHEDHEMMRPFHIGPLPEPDDDDDDHDDDDHKKKK